MTVIEASSVRVQTLADGTLRVTCDIEPRDATAAFQLFGMPGAPMALAALRKGATADPEPSPTPSEEVKGGPLSKWAALRCQEQEFWRFLQESGHSWAGQPIWCESAAADLIRHCCGIGTRAELDHKPEAAAIFNDRFRHPFQRWLIRRGVTA